MAKDSERPLPAKIIRVVQQTRDEIMGEALIIKVEYEGKNREEDFASPLLTLENMLLWRRITLAAIFDQRGINIEDPRIQDFEEYKKAVEQKDVYIAYDGVEVYALGANPKNMFFPYEYGLR